MIRFEILLPLFYNDGRPIEDQKFFDTDQELLELFGASSTDSITVRGNWKYKGITYSDKLVRVRVEVEDTPTNWDTVRGLKETLKGRFEQIDIWITAHRIEII
jgi:hypothetical protein